MNNPLYPISSPANVGRIPQSPMSGTTGVGRSFAASSGASPMDKFRKGLARQKAINDRNFPVKRQPSQLGTMTFNNLQPRESQAATGGGMGTMAPARKFPVAPAKTYGSDFVGPVPAGSTQDTGLLPPPATASAPRRFPVAPSAPKPGFSAYMDEQMGGNGWKMSTKDGKSGFVAQGGPNAGQTKEQITSGLRSKFLSMSPEQRAKYDEQAAILGGTAGRPVKKTDPEEGANEDPSMMDEEDESYFG